MLRAARVVGALLVPAAAGGWRLLYAIMNFVVVPLSAAGVASKDGLWIGITIAVHALLIGVPIALAARAAGEHVDTGGLRSTHG